jgi:hypothetical protein
MSDGATAAMVRTHLRWGWGLLLVFLSLGAVLEALHGFKVAYYVDVANEARQTMWRLAHAHGTLLGLLHLAFAATLQLAAEWQDGSRRLASRALVGAGVLLPAGFFLGGFFIRGGDPGLGILLVPLGAVLLFVAVLLAFRGCAASGD